MPEGVEYYAWLGRRTPIVIPSDVDSSYPATSIFDDGAA